FTLLLSTGFLPNFTVKIDKTSQYKPRNGTDREVTCRQMVLTMVHQMLYCEMVHREVDYRKMLARA
ncbi:AAEL015413-PA, partial [Aedes aegypti]